MAKELNTAQRNLCLRRIRKYKYRWLTFCFLLFFLVIICQQKSLYPLFNGSSICEPIDVVYTWVNGSDIAFIEALKEIDPYYDVNRFDDKNELRYSLRSLEKYAKWIRHIYIVTNGQIPYWLDLSNERITIVPHELITPDRKWLPTYSSAAIETFLHRIPNLSKRFLYLNDDIFLNEQLYPEDLYTDADGVRIYQAWLVPDCAENCPWTYIGDGACDHHCNIVDCQFDGGDCFHEDNFMTPDTSIERATETNDSQRQHHHFIRRLTTKRILRATKKTKAKQREKLSESFRKIASFREFMDANLKKNNTLTNAGHEDLHSAVETFNYKVLRSSAQEQRLESEIRQKELRLYHTSAGIGNETLDSVRDVYSQSLIYTNMLLNRHYGFKPRRILAHVGFLLDRTIIEDLQRKFSVETLNTVQHRFRTGSDLQFAFVYYSFVMEETRRLGVKEIFQEFDTDNSGTWSDREIRTLLARLFPLPLSLSALRFLEDVINNCSRSIDQEDNNRRSPYTTLIYERYVDSNLPTVTERLVEDCQPLNEALQENFSLRPKYRFHVNPRNSVQNNFMMLTSNLSEVAEGLDKLRKNPRKFNCINDNLQPGKEDNDLIYQLLEDFYLSFFPKPSEFELPATFRNRFDHWRDYQRWKRRKRAALVISYGVSVILITFIAKFICKHKAKLIRGCVQKL